MTWTPEHVLVGIAVMVAPGMLLLMIALVRGYSFMFWKRMDHDDPVFYFGQRRLREEREDDDDD